MEIYIVIVTDRFIGGIHNVEAFTNERNAIVYIEEIIKEDDHLNYSTLNDENIHEYIERVNSNPLIYGYYTIYNKVIQDI